MISDLNNYYTPATYNGSLNVDMAKKFSEEESTSNTLPEYRHVHGDPLLDFDNPIPDKQELEDLCNDWDETEFVNIDIDISGDMLDMLVRVAEIRLKNTLKPCSYNIWEERRDQIEHINDLHDLVGECIINDQIVDAIIAGMSNDSITYIEPYYISTYA